MTIKSPAGPIRGPGTAWHLCAGGAHCAGQDSLILPRRAVKTAFAFRGPGTTTETTGALSRAGMVSV